MWVHIADVSSYVSPRSPVDREAYRRGTSVYVPGAVEPMLPAELSNGACSLVPGEDRSALTVELTVRGQDVVGASFYRSVIRSDRRLTYPEVDAIFAGDPSFAALGELGARAGGRAWRGGRPGRAAGGEGRARARVDRARVLVRPGRQRGRRRTRRADRVAPADRVSDDRRQRAGGSVPRGSQGAHPVPGARAPGGGLGAADDRPARVARRPDPAGVRWSTDAAAGGRRWRARRRRWWPTGSRRTAVAGRGR